MPRLNLRYGVRFFGFLVIRDFPTECSGMFG
jgi:hypothetical protein